MTLSAQVAAMEREIERLRATVEILQTRLEMQGEDVELIDLMVAHRLTRGEAAALQILAAHSPRPTDRYAIEAAVPARDHAHDRDVRIVDVLICRLRKKLGASVIETVQGAGWRINPKWKLEAA